MSGERRVNDRHAADERLFQTLGRIEAKVDAVEQEARDTKEYARDISERVRSLEVSRGWFVGAGAGVGALMAWVMGFFQ